MCDGYYDCIGGSKPPPYDIVYCGLSGFVMLLLTLLGRLYRCLSENCVEILHKCAFLAHNYNKQVALLEYLLMVSLRKQISCLLVIKLEIS